MDLVLAFVDNCRSGARFSLSQLDFGDLGNDLCNGYVTAANDGESWMSRPLDNAQLAPHGTFHDHIPPSMTHIPFSHLTPPPGCRAPHPPLSPHRNPGLNCTVEPVLASVFPTLNWIQLSAKAKHCLLPIASGPEPATLTLLLCEALVVL